MSPTIVGTAVALYHVLVIAITWYVANRGKVAAVVADAEALAVNDPRKSDLTEKAAELRKLLADVGGLVAVLKDHGIAVPVPAKPETPATAPATDPQAPLRTIRLDTGIAAAEIHKFLDNVSSIRISLAGDPKSVIAGLAP
jgi:hypothetical protein